VNVAALTSALQVRGVCVAVDGAHAPGSIPLDMDSIGADFYTGNFHKWCCAPRGAGFLAVGSGRVDDLVPGVVGSRADEGFPTGFEWSGARDYSAILSVPAALRLFQELGWSDVQARNRAMVTRGGELLRAALHAEHAPGAELPMAVVPLPGSADPQAVRRLREEMAARGIEVAMVVCRGRGHVRLSCHLYNHLKDFERLARALEEVVPRFLGNPGAAMG
jgi:isopenicillin-N epimerase